jgi:hypothetical protein
VKNSFGFTLRALTKHSLPGALYLDARELKSARHVKNSLRGLFLSLISSLAMPEADRGFSD